MNKRGFIEFLENKKKSERTIKNYTDFVQQYEPYLFEYKNGKKIEKAGEKELHDFENRNTGIPLEDVLELVKLSDQARIGGHKKVRARLYHEAGLDTIDKMAACDPEKMRKRLADFIQKTGFKGIPPTPGEAQNTVTMAKYIKRLVQY